MANRQLLVVAGALRRADDTWLMHRRPLHKHHGGLWEFPGGKVENRETATSALCRELREEIGILVAPDACEPLGFAESLGEAGSPDDEVAIVILLYMVRGWKGEPLPLEGGEIGWFTAEKMALLDRPPLDRILCERLFGQVRA